MLKISYLKSLHPLLFENISHVKYFLNFDLSLFLYLSLYLYLTSLDESRQLWPFHLYSRRITITSLHDYSQTGQFWKPKPGKTHVCNFREVPITAKPLAKSYERRKRGTFIGINMLSNHVVGIDLFYCIWDSFIVYGTLLLYVVRTPHVVETRIGIRVGTRVGRGA